MSKETDQFFKMTEECPYVVEGGFEPFVITMTNPLTNTQGPMVVTLAKDGVEDWLNENTTDKWEYCSEMSKWACGATNVADFYESPMTTAVRFASKQDAILYKLTWGGDA